MDLMNYLDPPKIIKAPFGYPGGKLRSINKILPHLPVRNKYIEVFGGTGVVLFNRPKSINECFNDRHSGITDFYKCIQDPKMMKELMEKIELSIHSRDFWEWCKETWDSKDTVDRAFRWYYMTKYSFSQMGRNFGRTIGGKNRDSGKMVRALPMFNAIHFRIKRVTIENKDFRDIIREYDSEDAVFYLDPPYLDTGQCYKHLMTVADHEALLKLIFKSKGFFAVSGYSDPLYNDQNWDESYSWKTKEYISGNAVSEANHKLEEHDYGNTEEILWLKK